MSGPDGGPGGRLGGRLGGRAAARPGGRTLVVTNDFPPRAGGIESFVVEVVRRLPPRVVVHTRRQDATPEGAAAQAAVDAALAERGVVVVRDPSRLLLPTPGLARRTAATARAHGCDRVWFGAAAPLGLLAPALRRAGVRRAVATTHGHEVWWARLPGSRHLLRRIAAANDVLTVLGPATGAPIGAALPRRLRSRLVPLAPGVDAADFDPEDPATRAGAARLRKDWGLVGRPVVVCVSRLVERKGQDVLLRALPLVRASVPGAALVLVGQGPRRPHLERLAASLGLLDDGGVVFAGRVPDGLLAAAYAAGDVFAMPCRDRRGGLETEGLGICFLEAAASGLPVVVGRSGGAPDAVQDGVTGLVVDGRDVEEVAGALVDLLADPERAAAMGAAGRVRVADRWRWQQRADALAALLDPDPAADPAADPVQPA